MLDPSCFETAGYKTLPPASSCVYPFCTPLTPPQNKTSQRQVEDVLLEVTDHSVRECVDSPQGMCRDMLNRGSTTLTSRGWRKPYYVTTKLLLSVRVLMMNVVYFLVASYVASYDVSRTTRTRTRFGGQRVGAGGGGGGGGGATSFSGGPC